MTTSIMLAKFLGLFFTVMGLGIFVNRSRLQGALADLVANRMLQLIVGMIPLFLGSFIVSIHNVWVSNWRVLITLFGWMFLCTGFYRLVFTAQWVTLLQSKMKSNAILPACIVLMGVGIGFLYLGFYCNFAH